MTFTRMSVGGVQHLIERAYRESGEHQYLRELLVNAIESKATQIEFGPEWRAVERSGVYRLMVADNGCGMTAEQLLKFLNTFGGGGKPIGDAHENYGVGSKTSLLPWNHEGVVVVSWTAEHPEGAMVWLMRDATTGEYGARVFRTADGRYEDVVQPFDEWADVKPGWIGHHGTVVICLGNKLSEDTFLGKGGDGDIKGISAYLNRRIWEIPEGVEIFVQELRSDKRSEWPRTSAEASGSGPRRWNRRNLRGAKHYVTYGERETKGELSAQGVETLADGTTLEWFLWEGERPAVHSYAHKTGYIAALYKNELYDTQAHIANFRSFGITHSSVRANLTLIARPPLTDGSFGVYPDTARNALKVQGSKRAGEPLPWAHWGQEFAENLPDAIRSALAKAGSSNTGTLNDKTWRSRLLDRFAARWASVRWMPSKDGTDRATLDQPNGNGGKTGVGGGTGSGGKTGKPRPTGSTTKAPVSALKSSTRGETKVTQVSAKGGLPDFDWTTRAELDESESFGAAWCSPSKKWPAGVVQIARDFPAIVEVKKYWTDRYPDHLAAQIADIVEDVYGEAMVARIAHSEALMSDKQWGRTRVESELRAPAALTMALLGLLSEDHVISARVSGLGTRRKP